MSGTTKYKIKDGRGGKLTIKITIAIRRVNQPVSAIRKMLEERNELLEDQCKVDVDKELVRLLEMGRQHLMRFKVNEAYRHQRRRAIAKHTYSPAKYGNKPQLLTKKQRRQKRLVEIRQRRNNAAAQWESAEKTLLELIVKHFPSEMSQVININGVVRCFDVTTFSHSNIKIKDKYIALVHAGNPSVAMLINAVHSVDFARTALDCWNNELFSMDKDDFA